MLIWVIVISPIPIIELLQQKFVFVTTLFDWVFIQKFLLIWVFIDEHRFCDTQSTLPSNQPPTNLLQNRPLNIESFLRIFKLPHILC